MLAAETTTFQPILLRAHNSGGQTSNQPAQTAQINMMDAVQSTYTTVSGNGTYSGTFYPPVGGVACP